MALISETKETEIFTESEWLQLSNELSLSPRQTDIFKQLFSGCSDKQIAMKLQISIPTVRTYLRRLFTKYDVKDRKQLVLYVVRHYRNNSGANG